MNQTISDRPTAIKVSELLFGAGLAAGAFDIFLGEGESSMFDYLPLLVVLGLAVWATRGRGNIARWLLTALMVLGIAGQVYQAASGSGGDTALGWAATALQAAAVAMLWTTRARSWFLPGGVAVD